MYRYKSLMLATFAFYIMTKCTDVYHHRLADDADKYTLVVYSLYFYAFVYFSTMSSSIQGGVDKLDAQALQVPIPVSRHLLR